MTGNEIADEQFGVGDLSSLGKLGGRMVGVQIPLDPTRTGQEAEALERDLRRLIVGQDEAIQQIVNVYQVYLAGLTSPDKPVANFLFLGPTGSGKTRIVEVMAESLLGTPRAVIKIDCAEFQHSHEIAKLIGSPPGYLGHRETHPLLSQEILNQWHNDRIKLSFVLFDEIEKASDALWNLLLGILDKGILTLGDNRRVDFSRTMIFMTSNLGAHQISSILGPNLGFTVRDTASDLPSVEDEVKIWDKIERAGIEAARKKFTPEFMNRLDKIVVFRPLGNAELRKILDIELSLLQRRVFNSIGPNYFAFTASEAAKEELLREGTDIKYGARHLKRAIERLVVQPMSNLIASGQVRSGDWIRVDFDQGSGRITFFKEAENLPVHLMEQITGVTIPSISDVVANTMPAEMAKVTNARSSRRI
jgi:ATP-dependent Clp protease ATP-binding subunit ClpA